MRRGVRLGQRAYGVMLQLLPESLRDRYGDEMAEAFGEELAVARRVGRVAALGVWLRAFGDVARCAPYEHWRQRKQPRPKEQRMQSFLSDLRFAGRSFVRQPGATALLIVTLVLAVAANTAVFTLLDGTFFRPFPFAEPSRLVYLNEKAPRWNLEFTGIDYTDFAVWRDRARAFESMALLSNESVNLADGSGSERVDVSRVTYDFATVLRIKPILGRMFTREEDRPKGPNVVAIGSAIWKERFGGSQNVIGKTLRINSAVYTIIGVLPPEAEFPDGAKMWLPIGGNPNETGHSYSYDGIGRLKTGVTIEQAAKDLEQAHQPIWLKSDSSHTVSPRVMPLHDRFVSDFRVVGVALGAGASLVLLIACANVAGAMLARSMFRRREVGIRIALGASGGRVVRQLLTESLALAALGGAGGALLGGWALRVLVAANSTLVPKWAALSVGPRTIIFSIAVVAATALLFGLAPALQLTREDSHDALGAGGTRTTSSKRDRRLLDVLVVAEIGLAVVLLATGGLLVRAYTNLRHVDPGFRSDGALMFRISLPAVKYRNGTTQLAFYQTLIDRLKSMPGVDHAALITCPPFTCHWGNFFKPEGAPPLRANETDPVTLMRLASPEYFATMGIQFVHGRAFNENEGQAAAGGYRPVVVNEEFARHAWPTIADPVGKRIGSRDDTSSTNWSTVVGVVKDVKHYGLARPMIPGIYFPLTRIDSSANFDSFAFVVHTSGNPVSLFPSIRAATRALDPELPVFRLATLHSMVDQSLAQARTVAFVLAAFAAIALTLAVGGIYAVLSYVVGRRQHEIGIRMALGAQSLQVLRMVVRQGLVLVAIGLAIGLPSSLMAARLVSSLLVGVTAWDPVTYVAVVALLVATGTVAAVVPARRAARVDPKIALSEGAT
ncbi:MAG TPA: ABC transporter permease [Gemmatimonadaceae bacterium]|nr:ABC transporter permease [Gemmatimonadaceae bacterium]